MKCSTVVALRSLNALVLLMSLVVVPRLGFAYDGLVEKRVFTIPSFVTVGGDVLKDVRFGYETYGRLKAVSRG
jgi:hypothetical protein